MTDKFRNKYRTDSIRLQHWNYGWNSAYFITICTANREHYFGDVANGKMQLSEIGKIADAEWLKTFEMRPDMNLSMGEYIIMPNHFHAIIIIGNNKYNRESGMDYKADDGAECTDASACTDAMHCVSTSNSNNKPQNKFGPQSKNLASIIRGFKIGVTTNARKIHADFAWQSRFHDHIIRNERAFQNITEYIKLNPQKWDKDQIH